MTDVFVGRSTFDLGYVCPEFPAEDRKQSADQFFHMAGGPALNAAIVSRALGGDVQLWSLFGTGPFARAVKDELLRYDVPGQDFAPEGVEALPVSSIVIVPANGSRTIFDEHPSETVTGVDAAINGLAGARLVMTDGFLPELAVPLARWARERGIPVVLDGGSWKPSTGELIRHVDYAIVSERFRPPDIGPDDDVISRLHALGPRAVAITRGARDILWSEGGQRGTISPPIVDAIDTLGAGDVFHGAFCYYFRDNFPDALVAASKVAAESCRYLGTREWIERWPISVT